MENDELDRYDAAIGGFLEQQAAVWAELRRELEDRPGWRFDFDRERRFPMWCFGVAAEARLVITVDYDTVHIFDADADRHNEPSDHRIWVDDLSGWLDRHEPEHIGLTDAPTELGEPLVVQEAESIVREEEDADGSGA
jgi:hypothetical protein